MSLSFKNAKSKAATEDNPFEKARNRVKFLNAMLHGSTGFRDHTHDAHKMDIDKVEVSLNENGGINIQYPISDTDKTLAPFSYIFPPMLAESVELRAPGFKSQDPEKKGEDTNLWGFKFNITVTELLPIADVVQKQCPKWLEQQKKAFQFQEDLFNKVATFIADNRGVYSKFRGKCASDAMTDLQKRKLSAEQIQDQLDGATKEKILEKYHNVMTTYAALSKNDKAFDEDDMSPALKLNPRNIKISTKAFVENKTGETEPADVGAVLTRDKNDESALKVREAYQNNLRLRIPKITCNGHAIKRKSIFDNPIGRGDTVRVVISPFSWINQDKAGLSAILKSADLLVRSHKESQAVKVDNTEYLPKGYDALAAAADEDASSDKFPGLEGLVLGIAGFIYANSVPPKTCTPEDVKDHFSDKPEQDIVTALDHLSDTGFVARNADGTITSVLNVPADDTEPHAQEEVGAKRKAGSDAEDDEDPIAAHKPKKRFSVPQ